jgi:tetratricopeptide (TPR) repeat protein
MSGVTSTGWARLQAAAFALALTGLFGLVAGGLYRSAAIDGRAPPLRNNYGDWITEHATQNDWSGVLRALRVSAVIDLGSAGVESEVIPILLEMARRTRDRESELLGLRALVERRRSDPVARNRLASALLRATDPDRAELREAERQSRAALALDPGSAVAHLNLGRVALFEERRAEAFDQWDQATRLDAQLGEIVRAELSPREAAAFEEFRTSRPVDSL